MAMDRLTTRYARALYQQAAERDEQQAVYRQLRAIADALQAEPRLLTMLKHPSIAEDHKVSAVLGIAATGEGAQATTSMEPFVRLLLRKGRASVLKGIQEAFLRIWDEDRGIVRAHLSSARQLTPEQLERVRQALEHMMRAVVEVDSTVNPDLIGGMSLRMGDRLVDGSLRGRLNALAAAMHRR